ncbi:MAG TPA: glycerophosphodiester phosphodiesterase family protein [Blastocatellia bacterium]|nr:glycerophosphodiester phosphodiesterase family protein [Blastocatellia bacterium]
MRDCSRVTFPKALIVALSIAALLIAVPRQVNIASAQARAKAKRPLLIAHRGASGYAPEHTLAAYKIAIEQGADFVEQDLQLTKDGVLICIHDADLARTTNAAEVFPDRARLRDPFETGTAKRGWYTIDFTLAEIKRLDAGSWFNKANPFAANPAYIGQRVPTMEEAIKLVGNRAGLYPELKHFTFYKALGFDPAEKLAAVLKAHGFDRPAKRDLIFIQSFYKEALLKMKELAPGYARVQLLPMETAGREKDTAIVTDKLAEEIAAYAKGAGPSKSLLKSADDVATFHKAGLVIHPYTFRGSTTAGERRPLNEKQPNGSTLRTNIIADIRFYIGYGIDGGFTDYPRLWKEALASADRKSGTKK